MDQLIHHIVLLRISAMALIVFVDQIYPELFVENTENYTLVVLTFLRDSIQIPIIN